MEKLAKILFIPVRNPERQTDPRIAPGIDPVGRERRARWVLVALIVAALGLFWAGTYLSRRENEAGIHSLSAEARHGLYARTLDELETICRDPAAASGTLREHCVAQAHFVLQLPECTDACQRATAIILPHAHR
jgi:hypothetical protein